MKQTSTNYDLVNLTSTKLHWVVRDLHYKAFLANFTLQLMKCMNLMDVLEIGHTVLADHQHAESKSDVEQLIVVERRSDDAQLRSGAQIEHCLAQFDGDVPTKFACFMVCDEAAKHIITKYAPMPFARS